MIVNFINSLHNVNQENATLKQSWKYSHHIRKESMDTIQIIKNTENLSQTVIRTKILNAALLFIDFVKAFDSIHKRRMEHTLLAYSFLTETIATIMTLYKNAQVKVHSQDWHTDYFVAAVLQGHLHAKGWSTETSEQVHLPQKQRFINRELHHHTTSKGMDDCW